MNVNKNSWHYRLVSTVLDFPRNDLCRYARQVVGAMLLVLLGVWLTVGVLWLLSAGFLQYFLPSLVEIWFFSFLFWALLGIIAMAVVREWARENPNHFLARKLWTHSKSYKEPSLAYEYMKAIKNKVCPSIDFVEKN